MAAPEAGFPGRANLAKAAIALSVLAVTMTACTAGVSSAGGTATPVVESQNSGTRDPMTTAMARRLPAGAFYVLGGPTESQSNVWEISSDGNQEQLTHNPRGYEIDTLAASPAGILLADPQFNVDELARWTSHGPQWLHYPHQPKRHIDGQLPDIRPDGEITYLLPPATAPGTGGHSFTIWTAGSFTAAPRLAYQQRTYPGAPVFGPDGQLAIVGPIGSYVPKGSKAEVRIISRNGKMHILQTGFKRLGYPVIWGQRAPALAVPPLTGTEKLFFRNGKQEKLPAGWLALSWNPAGTKLLAIKHHALGVWSPDHPNKMTIICTVNSQFQVFQISWLAHKAPL